MTSIIKFELDIDPENLIIRPYDQWNRGDEISINELLNYKGFEDSKIGIAKYKGDKREAVDPIVRKSKSCKIYDFTFSQHNKKEMLSKHGQYYTYLTDKGEHLTFEFQPFSELLEGPIKKMVPTRFKSCVKPGVKRNRGGRYESDNNKYIATKYTKGDFFAKHSDSIANQYHFATVLILIPSIHEGGILRVWDQDFTLHEFDSSKITKITVVAFNPSFQHECTEITSGTRLIFKTDWFYDKHLFDLAISQANGYSIKQELEIDNSNLIQEIWDIKHELNDKMDELIKTITNNESFDTKIVNNDIKQITNKLLSLEEKKIKVCAYQIEEIINYLKTLIDKKKYAIIPLMNFYPLENVEFLYNNELQLFNALTKVFGKIGIKNIEKKEKYETNLYEPDDTYVPNEDDGPVAVYGKMTKYHNKYSNYDTMGDTCNNFASRYTDVLDTEEYLTEKEKMGHIIKKSEYNDSTYDSVFNISYTCFIVKLYNHEAMFTFVSIWQLRKGDYASLWRLPKDVVKMIVSFIKN